MKVEALKDERIIDFIGYCNKHRMEIDDSFLYDEDLRDFKPNNENPTYIITTEQGEIIAAASILMDEYNRRGKKARFRIFHSEIKELEYYNVLKQAILKHTEGLDKVFIFVPEVNKNLIEYVEGLKFNIERYSFLLIREDLEVPDIKIPEDYTIRPLVPGIDDGIWCDVRNAGFATLLGNIIYVNK